MRTPRKIAKTAIEISAELENKIALSLRAIGRDQTPGEFLDDMMQTFFEDNSGFFEGLIEDEDRRPEIEAELAKIRSASTITVEIQSSCVKAIERLAKAEKIPPSVLFDMILCRNIEDIEAGRMVIAEAT